MDVERHAGHKRKKKKKKIATRRKYRKEIIFRGRLRKITITPDRLRRGGKSSPRSNRRSRIAVPNIAIVNSISILRTRTAGAIGNAEAVSDESRIPMTRDRRCARGSSSIRTTVAIRLSGCILHRDRRIFIIVRALIIERFRIRTLISDNKRGGSPRAVASSTKIPDNRI